MKRILFLGILTCLFSFCTYAQIKKERKVEKEGFVWYELKDEKGNEGAEDMNGNILIPLSKEFCRVYFFKGYFSVIKEIRGTKYNGIYDVQGNEIIPISRNYSDASWWAKGTSGYFQVEKKIGAKTYVGACDKWGKEIISPDKYDYERFLAVFYYPTKDVETGLHGFAISDHKEPGWKHYNLNIFLDSDNKAYSLNNGSRTYISDGTNGFSNNSSNESVTEAKGGMVESVWYDHDVSLNGQKGMKIHFKGRISGYKGQNIKLGICHFFYYENGKKLWGNTTGYTTDAKDQVVAMVEGRIKPEGSIAGLTDWWVFIPYTALHCNKSCTLKIVTVMRDNTNETWLGEDAYVTYINYYAANNTPTYNPPAAFTPFYCPIPKFNFSPGYQYMINALTNFGGIINYGGSYNDSNDISGGGSTPLQLTTKHCDNCNGTGNCNICGGSGWVNRIGLGESGYCASCNNHDGRCRWCRGRGTWKE